MSATEITIGDWLWGEDALIGRAQQIIRADQRDGTALFPWWVEFLLYGAPYGGFNLNAEPQHSARNVQAVKEVIDRDAFRRVDWDRMRRLIEFTQCNCEHENHFPEGEAGHRYMGPPAGRRTAQHVGRVCDSCAATCVKDYLI